MRTREPSTLAPERRKYPGLLGLTNDIMRAIRTVCERTERSMVSAGPMQWRAHYRGGHVQHWPVICQTGVPYSNEDRFQHTWWRRAHETRDMHPAVLAVLADDWLPDPERGGLENLVLEYPSFSTDMRLAYVQSEDKGKVDRWTVTTAGKYIKSRWSYLDDHYIRDVVARTATAAPQIWHDPREIVRAVQYGPSSCMQWGTDDVGDRISDEFDPDNDDGTEFWVDNWKYHPYSVYDPRFGWRMAVRMEGPQIMARALVLHHSGGPYQADETLEGSVFVRSYRRTDSYSPADEALEAWLQHNGVSKQSHWPLGAKFARVNNPQARSGLMMPYIDGSIQSVTDEGSYVRLSNRGMACNNTDGTCGDDDSRTCEDCGQSADEEDGIHVGYNGDRWVGACCSDGYTYVLGRRCSEYYVRDDEVIRVNDEYYDINYLNDNSIVALDDGEYVHEDDAFCCPIDDCWYHIDDGRQDTEDEGYVHESNAWQCYGSDNWYSTNTDWVLVDGEKYHPDYAPDDEEAEPGSTFDLPYDKPEGSIPNEAQLPLRVEPDLSHMVDEAPKIYAHRATHARGARYRAGKNGQCDVWGYIPGFHHWSFGCGEPNESLTDPTLGYYLCPLPELETA